MYIFFVSASDFMGALSISCGGQFNLLNNKTADMTTSGVYIVHVLNTQTSISGAPIALQSLFPLLRIKVGKNRITTYLKARL